MLGIHVPVWYVIAIFIAMCAGIFVPLPFVAKTRRIYFEDVGSILVPCVICSAKIGEQDVRPHFASVHSEEFRHFRRSFWIVRICPNRVHLAYSHHPERGAKRDEFPQNERGGTGPHLRG